MHTLAAMMNFKIWSQDISQVYLQRAKKLFREVYYKADPELIVPQGNLHKLLKSINGLSDSGDIWKCTFSNYSRNKFRGGKKHF